MTGKNQSRTGKNQSRTGTGLGFCPGHPKTSQTGLGKPGQSSKNQSNLTGENQSRTATRPVRTKHKTIPENQARPAWLFSIHHHSFADWDWFSRTRTGFYRGLVFGGLVFARLGKSVMDWDWFWRTGTGLGFCPGRPD